MLSDSEILNLVIQARDYSIGYGDRIGEKRETLMDYYNMRPYGDEIEGRSSFVSSEVSDVVETLAPTILNTFTRSYDLFDVSYTRPEEEEEARQKAALINHCLFKENQGAKLLLDAIKDSLLQYTGTMKAAWNVDEKVVEENLTNLTNFDVLALEQQEGVSIEQIIERQVSINGIAVNVFDVKLKRTITKEGVNLDTVAPENTLVSPSARCFRKPPSLGERTLVRRSELLEMGFDRDIVEAIPAYDGNEDNSGQAQARYYDQNYDRGHHTSHKPNDMVWLTELYLFMDVDGDGIAELWQVFEAGDQLLEKNIVEENPYGVLVSIPTPHKAIGTCPAEQVADLQYTKSILVRHMLDNIYQTNFQRFAINERVDLDDLLTPRPGGAVRIDGEEPVSGSIEPLITTPQVQQILQSLDFLDISQEKRSGVTRFNQGLNPEALNQTATGFRGIDEYSQQRVGLIMKNFAEGGLKDLGNKILRLYAANSEGPVQLNLKGEVVEVDPSQWQYDLDAYVRVSIASGSRQEKIINLNQILERQVQAISQGSVIADEAKVYNTLEDIVQELGLKDASLYFNNPEIPAELAQAENEQLKAQLEQMQGLLEQQQNQLAEAEQVRAQAELIKAQMKKEEANQKDVLKAAELDQKDRHFQQELAAEDEKNRQDLIKDLTELELKYNKDVPGSSV